MGTHTTTVHQSNYLVSQIWVQLYIGMGIALITTAAVLVVDAPDRFAVAQVRFFGTGAIQSTTGFTSISPSPLSSIPFFKLVADYGLTGMQFPAILGMITFASP